MNAQHTFTPGPWISERMARSSRVKTSDGLHIVATCSTGTLSEVNSNARLIATTPRLLAIANMAASLRLHMTPSDCDCNLCELIREAQSAIADAVGTQS